MMVFLLPLQHFVSVTHPPGNYTINNLEVEISI